MDIGNYSDNIFNMNQRLKLKQTLESELINIICRSVIFC